MKRFRQFGYLALVVGVALLLMAMIIAPLSSDVAPAPSQEQVAQHDQQRPQAKSLLAALTSPAPAPEQMVQRAWQRAQELGIYHFASEIVQTTYPAPAIANFGRTSRQEMLHLEGDMDLPAHAIGMSLWKDGNVLNPRDGLEVRIGGTWQEMDDFSDAFAPGGDLMAYLAGAKNVKRENMDSGSTFDVSRFTFDLDGPSFALYLRDQLEAYLRERGELPLNLRLESSRVYRETTGHGEIWLDDQGLPARLVVHLAYPAQENGERVEADIRTDFRFSTLRQAQGSVSDLQLAANQSPTSNLQLLASSIQSTIRNPRYAIGLAAFLGVLGLVLLVLIRRRSKPVYTTIVLAVIFSLVVVPLMQSQQAAAFFDRQAAKRAEYEQRQEQQETARELQAELSGADWDPHRNPLQVADASTLSSQSLGLQNQAPKSPISNIQYPVPNTQYRSPASPRMATATQPTPTATATATA